MFPFDDAIRGLSVSYMIYTAIVLIVLLRLNYSALSIYDSHYSLKNSRKTPNSLPVRVRYGLSFVSANSDWSVTIVMAVLCALSCYTWPRYIESLWYQLFAHSRGVYGIIIQICFTGTCFHRHITFRKLVQTSRKQNISYMALQNSVVMDYISIWMICHHTSKISRTLVGNKIVDHSDEDGASPVGAAPTTS